MAVGFACYGNDALGRLVVASRRPRLVIGVLTVFDASRRARQQLQATGLVTPEEDQIVGKVLGAAAMTYVAGTLTSILQLIFFLIRAGGVRRRDDDRYA